MPEIVKRRPLIRAGNVRDNAAMESFFSSLKTERTAPKSYRTRNEKIAPTGDLFGGQPLKGLAPPSALWRTSNWAEAISNPAPQHGETFAD